MSGRAESMLSGVYGKLAALVRKLPGGLQRPILDELEPIRQVFLDRRPPRLVVVGSAGMSIPAWLASLGATSIETGVARDGWRQYPCGGAGARLWILDARDDVPDSHVSSAMQAAKPDAVVRMGTGERPFRGLGTEAPVLTADELGESRESFLERLCEALPSEARLEFARSTGARRAQAAIASTLLKSFSGVCGAVGLQPIPLADLPVLTGIQSLMIGLIIHTSGKPLRKGLVAEFLAAMGVSMGAGFVFREAARAAVRIVPFWGNAVSGFVAAAGTYALGRAAIVYFIEGSPVREARRVFQSLANRSTKDAGPR